MGETTATYTRCLMNEFVTTENKLNKIDHQEEMLKVFNSAQRLTKGVIYFGC